MEPTAPARGPRRKIFAALALLLGATLALGAVSRPPERPGITPPIGPPTCVRSGPVEMETRLDRTAVMVGGDGLVRMELLLRGEERVGDLARVATDLVVVLDRSGSMEGHEMEQARRAVLGFVDHLGPRDRFALVSYSDGASLDVALSAPTDGARETWRHLVRRVRAGGGTAMSAGLDLANEVLEGARGSGRAARVVLISDGLANRGDSSRAGLESRAARAVAREAIVSTVGVGDGFNEFLMTAIADAGTGNFHYLTDASDMAQVFRSEFEAAATTVASNLTVTLDAAPGVDVVDAAGFPLQHGDGAVRFRPGALFAGQERRLWVTWRVPVDEPSEHVLGRVALSYVSDGRAGTLRPPPLPQVACVRGEGDFVASLDTDAWAEAVVQEEASALRQDVAREVSAGRRERAIEVIEGFLSSVGRMNGHVGDDRVAESLHEMEELRDEVDAAFAAPNPSEAQNELSKQQWSAGQRERRAGSTHSPATP